MAEVYFCHFFYLTLIFILCVWVLLTPGMSVYHMHAWPEEGIGFPELELDSCKLPYGYCELNLDLLWKQQVLPAPISFLIITISAVGNNLIACDSILKIQVHIKITII